MVRCKLLLKHLAINIVDHIPAHQLRLGWKSMYEVDIHANMLLTLDEVIFRPLPRLSGCSYAADIN